MTTDGYLQADMETIQGVLTDEYMTTVEIARFVPSMSWNRLNAAVIALGDQAKVDRKFPRQRGRTNFYRRLQG